MAERSDRPAGTGQIRHTSGTGAKGGTRGAANTVLIVALVFFFLPWLSAAAFGFTVPGGSFSFNPLLETLDSPRAMPAIIDTLLLTVASTVMMLILLVPTVVFLNLKAPGLAKIAEMFSVLPLVVPAVALVSGVSEFYRAVAPAFINSMWSLVPLYVVLSMPLCYRAIDAGVKALDLRTLFSASSSLGSSTFRTLWEVVLPNLRVAMLSAALLCVTMCLGEYAMAALLLHYTFPVFMVEVSGAEPRGIAALSFITTVITWLLLVAISALSRDKKSAKN